MCFSFFTGLANDVSSDDCVRKDRLNMVLNKAILKMKFTNEDGFFPTNSIFFTINSETIYRTMTQRVKISIKSGMKQIWTRIIGTPRIYL